MARRNNASSLGWARAGSDNAMSQSNPDAEEILAEIRKVGKRASLSQARTDKVFTERNTLFLKAHAMKVPMAQMARAAGISESAVRCVVVGRGK